MIIYRYSRLSRFWLCFFLYNLTVFLSHFRGQNSISLCHMATLKNNCGFTRFQYICFACFPYHVFEWAFSVGIPVHLYSSAHVYPIEYVMLAEDILVE